MGKIKDITGQVFGRLVALEVSQLDSKGRACWRCLCSCGNYHVVPSYNLGIGNTTSCGCYQREKAKATATTHGQYHTSTYKIWSSMVARCSSPKNMAFDNYGGRGITVCESWKIFENFFKDMGQRPLGKTLDRVDNDKGYSLLNCRWVTREEQGRNKRGNIYLLDHGKKVLLLDYAASVGKTRRQVYGQYRRGTLPEGVTSVP